MSVNTNPSHPGGPASIMSTPILFDQERTALGRLQQLVKERSTAEQEIASAYQAVTLDADREVQRARRLISNARKKATEELDSDHRAALADMRSAPDSCGW